MKRETSFFSFKNNLQNSIEADFENFRHLEDKRLPFVMC